MLTSAVPTGAVVTNDFAQMTLDLSTEWTAYHRDGAPQLYPEHLRDEIGRAVERKPRLGPGEHESPPGVSELIASDAPPDQRR